MGDCRWCKPNILQRRKKCIISDFQYGQIGRGGTKYSAPPSAARKLMWIKANVFYSSYSFDKAFHLPEFQAKLSGRILLRQPLNLSTRSPLTLPPLPGGSVPLPLLTPPGDSILPSLSLPQADSTPPPLPPFLGGPTLPPPLLEVSTPPPPLQFYTFTSNAISRRIYYAL